jgi:hypothetical protein
MLLAGRSATLPSALAPEDTGDAAWIAQRMVLDAGAQAARLRQQASVQAATICAAAERETEMIWQLASAQAAAIREAAEREAAELRAAVMKLSAGSGDLLTIDGNVASLEVARLVGKPGTRTAGKPPTKPQAKPRNRRAAGPTSARRPQRPPRQLVAFRVAATATAALVTFAVVSAGVEVATFGLKFFVFRTAVGESGPGVPTDQQFLAQEAASAHEAADKAAAAKPAAHKPATPGRHSAKKTTG